MTIYGSNVPDLLPGLEWILVPTTFAFTVSCHLNIYAVNV